MLLRQACGLHDVGPCVSGPFLSVLLRSSRWLIKLSNESVPLCLCRWAVAIIYAMCSEPPQQEALSHGIFVLPAFDGFAFCICRVGSALWNRTGHVSVPSKWPHWYIAHMAFCRCVAKVAQFGPSSSSKKRTVSGSTGTDMTTY